MKNCGDSFYPLSVSYNKAQYNKEREKEKSSMRGVSKVLLLTVAIHQNVIKEDQYEFSEKRSEYMIHGRLKSCRRVH